MTGRKSRNGRKPNGRKNGKRGRPKRIFDNGDRNTLLKLAAAGATDAEMAAAVGCERHTLYRAYSEEPLFSTTIKKAKAQSDDRVVRSLYERACGYDYTERDITDSEKDGHKETVHLKQMAPDVAAAFIWLKNRRPEEWRDRREVAVSGLSLGEALDLCDEK